MSGKILQAEKSKCKSWGLGRQLAYLSHSEENEGFPGGSDGKESSCNAGDLGLTPGLLGSPGGGHGNPLQYSYLENPHGQRKLVGPRPWGHTESDTTKHKPVSHREN